MNDGVAGQALFVVYRARLSTKICHQAARFLNHQTARRAVPRAEPQFPESIESSASDVAEVKRRGTYPAHGLRFERECVEIVEVIPFAGSYVVRESGGQKTHPQGADFRYLNSLMVQERAQTPSCGKNLLEIGVIDNSPLQLTVNLQPDRNAKNRQAVSIVGGAVERIDNPGERRSGRFRMTLFGQNAVGRESVQDPRDDEFFRGHVKLGYNIDVTLVRDGEVGAEVP